jgi:hypothetical protein
MHVGDKVPLCLFKVKSSISGRVGNLGLEEDKRVLGRSRPVSSERSRSQAREMMRDRSQMLFLERDANPVSFLTFPPQLR